MTDPVWAQEIELWVNPVSVIAALIFPSIRAGIRKFRGKAFKKSYLVHDAMSGLALPSFVVLCMMPIAPSLLKTLEHSHLFLAGALGIVFVLTELVSPDGDEDKDECKHAILGLCRPTPKSRRSATS